VDAVKRKQGGVGRKSGFFVRAGSFLKRRPEVSGLLGFMLLFLSWYLLQESGVLFVFGFCLGMLGLAAVYIMYRAFMRA